jgi:hypothetical protein
MSLRDLGQWETHEKSTREKPNWVDNLGVRGQAGLLMNQKSAAN